MDDTALDPVAVAGSAAAPQDRASSPVAIQSGDAAASDALDFGEKKKKKKKKKEEGDEVAALAGDVKALDFGEKKKKKKKRPDLADFEESLSAGTSGVAAGSDAEASARGAHDGADTPLGDHPLASDLSQSETSLAHDGANGAEALGGSTGAAGSSASVRQSEERSHYLSLLDRVFQIIRRNNPELAGEKKRYTIALPQVHREGSKKTVFANVADICRRMHRAPEHVIQYLFAELGTNGSVDGTQRLVIKGKFQQKQIENVLKRYIVEYVTCQTCKSPETTLTKQNRMYFLHCDSCGSSRSVAAIKTGFQAQTMRRAAIRAAAAQ